MKYKAVVFDLFGTLAQNITNQEYDQQTYELGDALGIERNHFFSLWKETAAQREHGVFKGYVESIKYLCSKLNLPVDDEKAGALAEFRHKLVRKALTPWPDAEVTLKQLKADGYKVGLLSNCTYPVPEFVDELSIAKYLDAKVFSCVEGAVKPDPKVYFAVCSKLDVSPKDCLFVGDGENNELGGAQEVGMTPVLIKVPPELLKSQYPEDSKHWQGAKVSSLAEVFKLL